MDAKYQKYYDKLKGKDYSSYVSNYRETISNVNTKMNSLEATISSPRWTEKGVTLIKKSVIPSLKNQIRGIETGFSALENACSQVKSLVSKLETLESLCNSLDSAIAAYNNATEEEKSSKKQNVGYYQDRVTETKGEIDNIISSINGITVNIKDESTSFEQTMEKLKEYNSLEALKQEFLGSLDDDSWYVDPAYAHRAKKLLLFDNTTGEILKDGDTLKLKKGETRILTVRVPHNAGHIKEVIRTSAGGDSDFLSGRVVKAKSDINPDPNVIDFVNYKDWSRHIPEGVDLHTNYYDWVITATETGHVKISQTCEYTVEENNGTPKAMVCIDAVVTD